MNEGMVVGAGPAVRDRVSAFFSWWERELPGLFERWEQERPRRRCA